MRGPVIASTSRDVATMAEYAVLITALLLERPMCLDCIAAKTELGRPSVRAYLEDIAKKVTIRQDVNEPCRACGRVGRTIAIRRDPERPSS